MSLKQNLRKKYPGLVRWSHKARGISAYYINGLPSKRLKVIGVTGTNGKTTTCHLIAKILEEAGERVGMASTTTFKVGGKEWVNKTNMTTISPFALQGLLRQMTKARCKYAIVETTSHAIVQYRNWGIRYFAVVLTNITHDHLDYHGSFQHYLETKTRLFASRPYIAVVNADDPSADKFMHFTAGQYLTYSKKTRASVTARKILPDANGTIFTLVLPTVQITIDFHLPGEFNISNALAAAAVAYGLKVPPGIIKKGLEAVDNVPGRMEKVEAGQDFTVLIDYAHTPDALEKAYAAIRPAVRGRLIAVLGACGDRDKTKRPLMGAIAGRFADLVVVTDEEPYTENPLEIIEQVAAGVPRGSKTKKMKLDETYFKINDRREGIAKALSLARKGDAVIITGMGAQEFKVVGHEHLPWIERKVVAEELARLGYKIKSKS